MLELLPASQKFFYIIAVGHFRPVARNSRIFACQYVRHAMNCLKKVNPEIRLLKVKILYAAINSFSHPIDITHTCYLHNFQQMWSQFAI
jgi:hypothetical protein